jgi:hypothetical protein
MTGFSRSKLLARLAAIGVLAGTTFLALPQGFAAAAGTDTKPASKPQIVAADAQQEAALVAAEDRRLTQIRAAASLARWQNKNFKAPYRLSTDDGYTLVLVASSQPYTLDDLRKLEPQTLLRMTDGSYVLGENIFVMSGATLSLQQPGGLTLRLASGTTGFTSIVSFGGKVVLSGSNAAPLNITSWDVHAGAPDTNTADGRAYIRAIGGQFSMQYVNVKDLGFWSGRTGGIALTGTNRPDLGAVAAVGKAKVSTGSNSPGGSSPNLALTPAGPGDSGPLADVDPGLDLSIPLEDYVSSQIAHTTIDGDAFGLFVTGANGLQITDTDVSNSIFAGIELHRFVTNGVIQRTTSTYNGGDGFNLDRATEGVVISEATSTRNAGDGFSLSGRPLSDGPSAVGSPLESYGNNSISNSTATNNAHYGIEVNGGFNIGIQNNQVTGGDMGIVVTDAATNVNITGNNLNNQNRHGIALVNGVSKATVTGNIVNGAATGIYLRDSVAGVKGNTVEHATVHGVSVSGSAKGTAVSYNVVAGEGASALDLTRAHGSVSSSGNQLAGWHDTTPWYFYLKKLLHPMTILWVIIFFLVVLSAIRSHKRKTQGLIAHPYAHQLRGPAPVTVLQPRNIDLRDEHDDSEYREDDLVEASG